MSSRFVSLASVVGIIGMGSIVGCADDPKPSTPGSGGTAGSSGTAGKGGSAGSTGKGGSGGSAGSAGKGGTAGTSGGTSGSGGTAGTGMGGNAGSGMAGAGMGGTMAGMGGTGLIGGMGGTMIVGGEGGEAGAEGGAGGESGGEGGAPASGGAGGDLGEGGESGAGGDDGAGGVPGTGGDDGAGGVPGAGGDDGAGGMAGDDGAGGVPGTGGAAGTAGTAGTSGTAGTAGTGSGPAGNLLPGYSFETGVEGWVQRTSTIAVSTEQAFDGAQSLKVTGRTSGWNGAEIVLTSVAMPGVAYTYTASFRYVPTVAAGTRAMISRFVDGPGCPTEGARFGWVANNNTTVSDSGWITLSGSYTIPAGCAPTTFLIYVESDSATASFYIDAVSMVQQ